MDTKDLTGKLGTAYKEVQRARVRLDKATFAFDEANLEVKRALVDYTRKYRHVEDLMLQRIGGDPRGLEPHKVTIRDPRLHS